MDPETDSCDQQPKHHLHPSSPMNDEVSVIGADQIMNSTSNAHKTSSWGQIKLENMDAVFGTPHISRKNGGEPSLIAGSDASAYTEISGTTQSRNDSSRRNSQPCIESVPESNERPESKDEDEDHDHERQKVRRLGSWRKITVENIGVIHGVPHIKGKDGNSLISGSDASHKIDKRNQKLTTNTGKPSMKDKSKLKSPKKKSIKARQSISNSEKMKQPAKHSNDPKPSNRVTRNLLRQSSSGDNGFQPEKAKRVTTHQTPLIPSVFKRNVTSDSVETAPSQSTRSSTNSPLATSPSPPIRRPSPSPIKKVLPMAPGLKTVSESSKKRQQPLEREKHRSFSRRKFKNDESNESTEKMDEDLEMPSLPRISTSHSVFEDESTEIKSIDKSYGLSDARNEAMNYALNGSMCDESMPSSAGNTEEYERPGVFSKFSRRISSITFLSNRAPLAPGEQNENKAEGRATERSIRTVTFEDDKSFNRKTKKPKSTKKKKKPKASKSKSSLGKKQESHPNQNILKALNPNMEQEQATDGRILRIVGPAEDNKLNQESSTPVRYPNNPSPNRRSRLNQTVNANNGNSQAISLFHLVSSRSMASMPQVEMESVPAPLPNLQRQRDLVAPGAWTMPRAFRSFVSSIHRINNDDQGDNASQSTHLTGRSLLTAAWSLVLPTRRLESVLPIAVKPAGNESSITKRQLYSMLWCCALILILLVGILVPTLVNQQSPPGDTLGTPSISPSTFNPTFASTNETLSPLPEKPDPEENLNKPRNGNKRNV